MACKGCKAKDEEIDRLNQRITALEQALTQRSDGPGMLALMAAQGGEPPIEDLTDEEIADRYPGAVPQERMTAALRYMFPGVFAGSGVPRAPMSERDQFHGGAEPEKD